MSTTPVDQPLRQYSDVEYVFRPHDRSLPATRKYLSDVADRLPFIKALAQAEYKGRAAGTRLGGLWSVLDPLLQALIYWFVFTAIRGRGGSDYFLMVVSGVFLFSFSMTCLTQGGRSIQRSKGLVLNSSFPLATVPLSVVYKALLELIPTMGMYALFHIAFSRGFTASYFFLPMMFVCQVAISVGAMLIFATLTVYMKDVSNLLDYVVRILFFMTPIIYPADRLDAVPQIIHLLLYLNPFFALFSTYQAILGGDAPSAFLMMQPIVWALVLPVVGFRLFVSRERGFALRL